MSPQIASLRLCKVTSIAFVWLFSTVRLKCLLNELWSAQAKSHGLHSFDFSPVWVFKCVFKWPACSLRGYKVTLVAFVWFFSTVRFQMFTERAWVSAGKVTQDAFFCVRYQMVLKMPVCESHKAARQLLLLLQGKGNHLQNGVLLHLLHLIALHHHVTLVWPPPCPPR